MITDSIDLTCVPESECTIIQERVQLAREVVVFARNIAASARGAMEAGDPEGVVEALLVAARSACLAVERLSSAVLAQDYVPDYDRRAICRVLELSRSVYPPSLLALT